MKTNYCRRPTHTGVHYEKKEQALMARDDYSRLLRKLSIAISGLVLITPIVAVLTS